MSAYLLPDHEETMRTTERPNEAAKAMEAVERLRAARQIREEKTAGWNSPATGDVATEMGRR